MTDEDYDEQFKREVLPDWAERYDPSGTIEPGRQLCTKDGRRIGNAYVIELVGYIHGDVWSVLTDAGNKVNMLESEIRGAFYIGDYISKSYTIPGLRNLKYVD